jgi:hypothetical protein
MITQIRYKLRDEASQQWSDDELLTNINFALSSMARKLRLWKNRFISMTSQGVDTYSIPDDFISPISVIVDEKLIPIKGIEFSLSSPELNHPCAFIDNDALILFPLPTSEVQFILNYNSNRLLKSNNDVLAVTDEYLDTILFYALSMSYQKQLGPESLNQSKYFLGLYEKQVNELNEIATKRRSSRTIKSNFQVI